MMDSDGLDQSLTRSVAFIGFLVLLLSDVDAVAVAAVV